MFSVPFHDSVLGEWGTLHSLDIVGGTRVNDDAMRVGLPEIVSHRYDQRAFTAAAAAAAAAVITPHRLGESAPVQPSAFVYMPV